jgi:CRP/FNR family cyclic AMP-dependent transcriptional regulator
MPVFDLLRREPDVRTFRAGETVFAEGEPGDCMFAILEGEVAIQKNGSVLEQVKAGGVFGEMALIDQHPRSASAVAVSDCNVVAIGQKRFVYLVEHVLADRLRRNTAS